MNPNETLEAYLFRIGANKKLTEQAYEEKYHSWMNAREEVRT